MRFLLLISSMLLSGILAAQTSNDSTNDDMFADTVVRSNKWFGMNEPMPDSVLDKYHTWQFSPRTASYVLQDLLYKQNDPYGFARKKAVNKRKRSGGIKKQIGK